MTNGEKYKKSFFRIADFKRAHYRRLKILAKLQKRTKMKTAAAVMQAVLSLEETGTAYCSECWRYPAQRFRYGSRRSDAGTLDVSNDGT